MCQVGAAPVHVTCRALRINPGQTRGFAGDPGCAAALLRSSAHAMDVNGTNLKKRWTPLIRYLSTIHIPDAHMAHIQHDPTTRIIKHQCKDDASQRSFLLARQIACQHPAYTEHCGMQRKRSLYSLFVKGLLEASACVSGAPAAGGIWPCRRCAARATASPLNPSVPSFC